MSLSSFQLPVPSFLLKTGYRNVVLFLLRCKVRHWQYFYQFNFGLGVKFIRIGITK